MIYYDFSEVADFSTEDLFESKEYVLVKVTKHYLSGNVVTVEKGIKNGVGDIVNFVEV